MSRKRLVRVGFAGLALAVVVFGAVGLRQYLRTVGGDTSWANVSAGVLNLFGPTGNSLLTSGEVPPSLEFAQLAGPLVTAFAAFELFRGRTERWFRRRRARSRTGHVVLIGCGASGRLIAEQLASRGEPCVIVVDEDAALAKDELFDRPRWAVINGSVSDSSTLVAAGAAHARLVHVATGQDGVDIDVAARLRQLAAPAGDGAMNVKVQIDSSTLCRRLQQEELERVGTDHVIVEYINMSSLTRLQSSSSSPPICSPRSMQRSTGPWRSKSGWSAIRRSSRTSPRSVSGVTAHERCSGFRHSANANPRHRTRRPLPLPMTATRTRRFTR